MRVDIANLGDNLPSADFAVAIDVIRAFTTAAAAFERGAESITCVESTDAALALRDSGSVGILMGEEGGRHIPGFDFDNSPLSLAEADVAGVAIGQRTSNGTRGVTAVDAAVALAAGATTASATVRWIGHRASDNDTVLLLCTGSSTPEDRYCAEFMKDLLNGRWPAPSGLSSQVRSSRDAHVAAWRSPATEQRVRAFLADIDVCADVDRHDFAMIGTRRADDGAVVLSARSC
ncbi:MAG: hypothetical protein GY708_15440 [Actinomycetia bacterium]|nr:hypothetical protein [Actinomycetes bacterium]MCP4961515.1 hypothetical protein [Actinomycetes bacterium]